MPEVWYLTVKVNNDKHEHEIYYYDHYNPTTLNRLAGDTVTSRHKIKHTHKYEDRLWSMYYHGSTDCELALSRPISVAKVGPDNFVQPYP